MQCRKRQIKRPCPMPATPKMGKSVREAFGLALAKLGDTRPDVVVTQAGISIGEDGPSQMGIEDVSLACSLPNFTVVVPADEISTGHAVGAIAKLKTPVYLRAGRPEVPLVYDDKTPFELGKATKL